MKMVIGYWEMFKDMTTNRYGILVQNCPKDSMIYNVVTNANTITAYPAYFHGIAVQTSTEVYMLCNDVTKVGYGVSFTGYCNNSKIVLTDLTSCYTGIRLENATIGTQGTLAQPWDNRWFSNVGPNRVQGTIASGFSWYRRDLAPYLITPMSVLPNLIISIPSNPNTLISCGFSPLSMQPNIAELPIICAENIEIDSVEYFETLYYIRKSSELDVNMSNSVPELQEMENIELTRIAIENNESAMHLDQSYPQNDFGYSHDDAYKVLLAFMESNTLTEHDTALVLPIAFADPLQFGEAVYSARVLLGIHAIPEIKEKNSEDNSVNSIDKLLVVFPNPSNGFVNLEFPYNAFWEIQVSTIDGKTIIDCCNNNESIQDWNLNLTGLEHGSYIVKARDIITGRSYSSILNIQ